MKRARVAYAGALHEATPLDVDGQAMLRLADGRTVSEDAVVWLPPFEVGTVIALGLNYADHAAELGFSQGNVAPPLSGIPSGDGRRAAAALGRSQGNVALPLSGIPSGDGRRAAAALGRLEQDEPLIFLKGPGTLLGHRGQTRRPAGVGFMHYECELAVVIGRPARQVARADAMQHVAGYTVANDYAIRDYLENWYRPNLRVKNRDGATVLGPWWVDADDIGDTVHLPLRTLVNGHLTQQGNTRDLVFDIPFLIEYLSRFMTLLPGDVILTGTPEGVVDVKPGDEVVCEIDGIGRLVNTIVGDAVFGLA